MNTTAKEITFDKWGVCNFCREYEVNNFKRIWEKEGLDNLVANMKKGAPFSCLIGLSGGVDSSYALHLLVSLGLKPLCFSIDNGWNMREADENIMRLVEGLQVPFYRYTINLQTFKELQIAFIKSGTANIEIPTDHILMASSYEMARQNGIRYIISGGNLATESIMPASWGYQARDLRFLKGIYQRFTGKPLRGLPTMSLLNWMVARFIRRISIVNLLDYFEYNREEAIALLSEKYGYKPYGDKHCESKFTQWFQNYYLITFFGIDKRKAHYSSLINSKQMTRDQALEKMKEPLTYYPIIDVQGTFVPHLYTEYKNSELWWNLFGKIYHIWKS